MIDLYETSCRICLEDGAMYPIFENTEEFDSVYANLTVCLQEKLEDLNGYPRNICIKCKNASETLCKFIATFEKTCEILQNSVVKVKTENLQDYIDVIDNEPEPFIYELQEVYEPSVELKAIKRNPAELLESLTHLTVKRIKVEDSLDNEETCIEHYLKRKRGQPKKAGNTTVNKATGKNLVKGKAKPTTASSRQANKSGGKSAEENKSGDKTAEVNNSRGKPAVAKKTVTKPAAKNNRASKQCSADISNPGIEKKKVDRLISFDKKQDKEKTSKVLLCDHCGATFSETENLKYHILKLHIERKFKCNRCPKEFHTNWAFKNHKKRHDNIRPFACGMCEKTFYERKLLTGHIRVVHENIKAKRSTYKCKFCDKTFLCKRSAVVHERSVHTGERPDVCEICGATFYDVVYLREHMRIHTGHTPFKCPVCARGYTQMGNMKSHMRNHRISQLDPETLAKIKPNYFKFLKP